MKHIKKWVALLMAALIAIAMLGACGNSDSPSGSASGSGAASGGGGNAKYKIGIMSFTFTSREASAVLDYCNNYLADAFDIEFQTFNCGFDNNSVITAVENMITAGMDGLILMNTSGVIEVDKICKEAGVPFTVIAGKPSEAEEKQLYESVSDEFVLCVHPETDPADAGRETAEVMLSQGKNRCAIVYTPPGMMEAADKESGGFIDAFTAGGGVIVEDTREIPGDAMITAADTVIASHGDEIDFMFGLLDILQAIVTDPKYVDKGIQIVSNELPADGGVSLFESGVLAFAHDRIPQSVGFAVVALLNYLNGDSYPDDPGYQSVECPYTDIYNAEDCQLYLEVANGTNGYPPAWTIEELKTLIIAENPDATYADLLELAASSQIDDICARHGIER